jgi:hypothetical protein
VLSDKWREFDMFIENLGELDVPTRTRLDKLKVVYIDKKNTVIALQADLAKLRADTAAEIVKIQAALAAEKETLAIIWKELEELA